MDAVKGPSRSIAVIGDNETVTGFLLAGTGERNDKAETNYFVWTSESKPAEAEAAFKRFMHNKLIAVILVNQVIAQNHLRVLIDKAQSEGLKVICEIPSKEHPYEPRTDPIVNRASRLLYGVDYKE